MAVDFRLTNKENKNYLTMWRWVFEVGESMESYTREGMKLLHQEICKRLKKLPLCRQRCSETKGSDRQQWCSTCENWSTQLLSFHRWQDKVDIRWDQTKSWLWPTHYECVTEVFLNLNLVKASTPNFKELTFQCSVWENCRQFNIQSNVIRNVRNSRNLLAHREKPSVEDNEREGFLAALHALLGDLDVKVDSTRCKKRLQSIKADEYIDPRIEVFIQEQHDNLRAKEQDKNAELERQMKDLIRQMNTLGHKMDTGGICTYRHSVISICAAIAVIIAGYILLPSLYMNLDFYRDTRQALQTPAEPTGCVDENYTYPFAQDFPQLDYISGHNDFSGRKWLIDDIQNMLEHGTSSSGLALIADMGYGKSAIISHIICAKEGDRSNSLRDHTIGFHVCRFDVEASKRGGRFIRRLIGFLSTKSPEFGNITTHLSNGSIIFSKTRVKKNWKLVLIKVLCFHLRRWKRQEIFHG